MLYYFYTDEFTFPASLKSNEEILEYKALDNFAFEKAQFLIPFHKALKNLEFEETPNYNYLKFILIRNLLN